MSRIFVGFENDRLSIAALWVAVIFRSASSSLLYATVVCGCGLTAFPPRRGSAGIWFETGFTQNLTIQKGVTACDFLLDVWADNTTRQESNYTGIKGFYLDVYI